MGAAQGREAPCMAPTVCFPPALLLPCLTAGRFSVLPTPHKPKALRPVEQVALKDEQFRYFFFPSLWRLGRVARNLLMIQCNTYKSQGLFLDGCGQSFPCMCTYQIQLSCIATWIRRSGDMKSLLMWEFQACINEEKMWLYLKCFLKPHLMLYYKQKKELSTLGMQYR